MSNNPIVQQILPRDFQSRYEWRFANVSNVLPLEVQLADGGDSLPVGGVNADYVAALDDTVLIMQNETDIVVVCQIVSGG